MAETFRGWGRSTASVATLVPVDADEQTAEEQLAGLLADASGPPVLARGLGRSYGDAATNAGGSLLARIRPQAPVLVDVERGMVTASAGTSIERILAECVPRGFTLPVLPGTRHVTLGGAVTADIHGKNHHRDGSFGRWVTEIRLIDGAGQRRRLGPQEDPEAFWATVGGMGLTGVITAATVRLTPVPTGAVRVTTTRVADLDELLRRLVAEPEPRYSVAWVDCLGGRSGRFRSVLDEAEPAELDDLDPREAADLRAYRPRRALPAPRLPATPLRPGTVRAFNAAWWWKSPARRTHVVGLDAFFFPLDVLAHWNRLYGPRGFYQYQLVVPPDAHAVLRGVLDQLVGAGFPPFLAVLKRMGPANLGPLSFPVPGWTLAVDLPVRGPALMALLDRLDDEVADAGGRIYLAKDSRARAETIARMYPRLGEWRAVRERLDPQGRLRSDLGRRTGLC